MLLDLGLGYLSLGRRSTTLSPGEAQRLRIASQLRSVLFGVGYVLDEPSAGVHPADAEPLLDVLDRLRASGNSLWARRSSAYVTLVRCLMSQLRRSPIHSPVSRPRPGSAGWV